MASIVKLRHCAAQQGLVAGLGTHATERATVRDGYAAKKLGLGAEAADAGIAKVVAQMKAEKQNSRVTFHYLLAEASGTRDKWA